MKDGLLLAGLAAAAALFVNAETLQLIADAPAKRWDAERYPLGNGTLGAMSDGGVAEEHIQFNVDSLWTGGANINGVVDDSGADRNYGTMGAYQNFGELVLKLEGQDNPQGYRRTLDLSTAVHTVMYKIGDATCTRESFITAPDNTAGGLLSQRKALNGPSTGPDSVLAIRITSGKELKGSLAFVGAHGEKPAAGMRPAFLVFSGKLPNGLEYAARAQVVPVGKGTVQNGPDGTLHFEGGNGWVVLLTADTSFSLQSKDFRRALPNLAERIAKAERKGFDAMKRDHVIDFQKYFSRVSLKVGTPDPAVTGLTTAARMKLCREGKQDADLEATLFQYGRYLLICSSWPGTLPANLQGIWNDSNNPPWHCDYHTNINIQMNYWGAETANLSEMHMPLFDWMTAAMPRMEEETRKAFPNSKGYAVRTSMNAEGGMGWRWNWPGAAWMAHHAFEHYDFTRDVSFLRKTGYPLLKGAAEFCIGFLKERPDGSLVVPNGWSPEHGPREDAVAHDQQIVAQLLDDVIAAQAVLKDDADFAKEAARVRGKLVGNHIGKWGQLQEWEADRDVQGDTHRHTSHLFAVYPGYGITPNKTPEFAKAAAVALEGRALTGDARRSWTWPWRMALWARMHNGAKAGEMLDSLLRYNTLDNLFTVHPPFQMDGNFGIVGAISEALVQSHDGVIELLPVTMPGWESGSVSGLRARGDVTVSFDWRDGKVVSASLASSRGGTFPVRFNGTTATAKITPGGIFKIEK